jgi:hypothetical protein
MSTFANAKSGAGMSCNKASYRLLKSRTDINAIEVFILHSSHLLLKTSEAENQPTKRHVKSQLIARVE